MVKKPHSSEYFGEDRNFWWNHDFLELMARRWELSRVRRVLDVGCGIGHWTQALAEHVAPDCRLTGIDREPQSIEQARQWNARAGGPTVSFLEGEAQRLPFEDGSFDMVTCQTLLIHVPDPLVVIREMLRVLVPGGLLVAVEPNNVGSNIGFTALERRTDEVLRLLEFQMTCERGKANLGEGFNSAGTVVPGWFQQAGAIDIRSNLSDKMVMLVPPYSSAHERAVIQDWQTRLSRDSWCWNREDTLRYFLAGEGAMESFDDRWREALAYEGALLAGIKRCELTIVFAPIMILVSGRKS